MKETLSVTLIQSDLVWEDTIANISTFEEKIARLGEPTDVIVLPEMFNTGFTMNTRVAEPMNLTTVKWMKHIARQTDALVTGSIAIKEGDRFYNRMLCVKPDGTVTSSNKRHLFSLGGEHLTYAAGQEKMTVSWQGWEIFPLVCYDLRFPVWSRNSTSNPYDLLIYVANWPAKRVHAWNTLLKARAIENQTFVVGVNRIGTDGNALEYNGDSVALDYLGEPIYIAGSREVEKTVHFSKGQLLEYRQKFLALSDADHFEIK